MESRTLKNLQKEYIAFLLEDVIKELVFLLSPFQSISYL